MRLAEFGIISALLLCCGAIQTDAAVMRTEKAREYQLAYNLAIDQAAEDALYSLAEWDDGRLAEVNRDIAAAQFFESLARLLPGQIYEEDQNTLNYYVPLLIFVERDGFSFYEWQESEGGWNRSFSDKILYSSRLEDMTIYYTLTDDIRIYGSEGELLGEGDYHDLYLFFSIPLLKPEVFDQARRICICNLLKQEIEAALLRADTIGRKYGWTYEFSLPVIDGEDWYNTIDDISVLALYQQYPFAVPGRKMMPRMAVGGARLVKRREVQM